MRAPEDAFSALVRHGRWYGDFTEAEFDALSERLRGHGLYIHCASWSDCGSDYEAAAPGIDEMTDLPDWASLMSDLENAVADCSTFAVILADVDRLGRVAALSSGWARRIVVVLGSRLRAVAEGEGCRLYRLRPNGDEFVTIVSGDDAVVANVAEQLWRATSGVFIPGYSGTTVIATTRRDNESPSTLLDRGMRLVQIVKSRARSKHHAIRELMRLTRIRPDEELLWASAGPNRIKNCR